MDDMMIVMNGTSGLELEELRGLLNHSRGVLCWVTHHRGGKPRLPHIVRREDR